MTDLDCVSHLIVLFCMFSKQYIYVKCIQHRVVQPKGKKRAAFSHNHIILK